MGITIAPGLYYLTPYYNQKNNGPIFNTRAKRPLNEFLTNFGVSKSTAAYRIIEVTKKREAVKFGNSCWCTINRIRGFIRILSILRYEIHNWIMNNPHLIILPIENVCVKNNMSVKDETFSVPRL